MTGLLVVAAYALREAVRRRVFVVVVLLTAAFLVLYGLGADRAFKETEGFRQEARETGVDTTILAGATVFGLSMFATLFLGTILVVFLTLGAVRGDAERGLLQPLIVRPTSRATILGGRFIAAASASAVYVAIVYVASLVITDLVGGWTPDHLVVPAIELVGAVIIMAAFSL
ncbi:MAG: ABC transporter permease subunit, partial [Gaiellales bacterium]